MTSKALLVGISSLLFFVPSGRAESPEASPILNEVTSRLGVKPEMADYPAGTYLTPEITPGGIALLDYDHNGLLDILAVCHPPPGGAEGLSATAPCRLFRQRDDGTFQEIPGAAGLAGHGFHTGVAVGDVNNDGFPDVYLTNYGGPDELFLGHADGTFTDATKSSGLMSNPATRAGTNWSSTAAFFDYDGDGNLDLFVAHFATFDPNRKCLVSVSADDADYCGPHIFPGQLATLYKGNGDGTFVDVTAQAGINAPARGWGLICADLTGDGQADILQANDEEPNQLWVNQGNGKFADEAVLRGCAFNAAGAVEANMGVAAGDVTNSGHLDLFITHITSETNTLFRDGDDGAFTDATATAGMGLIDRPFTGWGCGFLDYDNDGNLDIAVVNGRVNKGPARSDAAVGSFWNRYAEPNLLFHGDGQGHFSDVGNSAGAFTKNIEVTRALAFGDLRNDGVIHLVTLNLGNGVRIYQTNASLWPNRHWIQILPMIGKREALGARVNLTAGGKMRSALCLRSYSYISCNDPRVHFGLGSIDKIDSVEICWPSGNPRKERFDIGAADRTVIVTQGKGTAAR